MPPELFRHSDAVDVKLARLCLIVHIRIIDTKLPLSSLYETTAQTMQLTSIIRYTDASQPTIISKSTKRIAIAVLTVIESHQFRHHPSEILYRMIFTCQILATLMIHRLHNE